MTQYQRITGKVFGGNATATGNDPQIAQFGSAQANTFIGTTDPATIQQLPAWGQGWIGAVTPDSQFPPLPEMTGAMKVLSHQICGILQQGVSTWDNGTIYYTGNFVSLNGKLYVSQVDENQGNNPETDTTNWKEFDGDSGLNGKITNCITSAPQRIKYTLVDGTFTLLAGSVVIVPYGTEDKTAEFPIGSTFIHENFKVYDRQFTDGRFTVWAEVQEDIARNVSSTSAAERFVLIDISVNAFSTYSSVISSNSQYSGTGSNNNYRTDLNIIQCTSSGTLKEDVISFPIGKATSDTSYLYAYFDPYQYTGQIGGSMWLDKDVEALIPNGKNEDGTQKNIEWKSQKLYITTQTEANQTDTSGEIGYNYDTDTIGNFGMYYQVSYDGYIYNRVGELRRIVTFGTWDTSTAGGAFKSYKPTQPFIAFDENKKYIASGWGYPSSKRINYAVGASQSKYTAPANGWVYGGARFTTNGNNYTVIGRWNGNQRDLLTISRSSYSGSCASLLPVKQGDIFDFEYSSTTNTNLNLLFFYAEGEV